MCPDMPDRPVENRNCRYAEQLGMQIAALPHYPESASASVMATFSNKDEAHLFEQQAVLSYSKNTMIRRHARKGSEHQRHCCSDL